MARRESGKHESKENIGEEFVENYGGPLTATQRRSKKVNEFINHGKL
jgi:hypothetical protein